MADPTQAGIIGTALTGRVPQYAAAGVREGVVIAVYPRDAVGNRSRSYTEYDVRDLYRPETYRACRSLHALYGHQNGDEYIYRAGQQTFGGKPYKPTQAAADTDGERVLVAFVDGKTTQPVILGALPHPKAAYGLTVADGAARKIVHNGATVTITAAGHIEIVHKNGSKIAIDDDATLLSRENTLVRLQADGDVQVLGDGKVYLRDNGAAEPYVLGEKWLSAQERLIDILLNHVHPTGVGPSGPMSAAPQGSELVALRGELRTILSTLIFGV